MSGASQVAPDQGSLLPGLNGRPLVAGCVEAEAREHLSALYAAGRLDDGHRLLVALVQSLARSVDMGIGKIAGVQAAKQLAEVMTALPDLIEADEAHDWADVVEALRGPASDGPA